MSQTRETLQAEHGGRRFRIEFGGEGVGYYVYIYEGERCIHDYLQDTLDRARDFAHEEFGVPVQSWSHEHPTA
jgi:hypothetical protein